MQESNLNSTREHILNSITELKNKLTNDIIPINKKDLLFESSKYSSTKENIWHVFINDIKIKKTSEYLISYKCLLCENINTIGTTQFLRKIRQCKKGCYLCSNISNYIKTKNNKENLTNKENQLNKEQNKEQNNKSLLNKYLESQSLFDTYPDQYKNAYLLSHLTNDDYNRIKNRIISFCNGKLCNIDDYEFWSIYKVHNQMNFSSVLYDRVNDIIFKGNQPILKCDNCSNNWRCKSLEQFKNTYKILCQSCTLCNRIFKIKPTKNINNDTIIYQSKLELKFINWCNSKNIIVTNGPYVDYILNNKIHKYRVDFQINDILIEISDIWHNNQVKNGIWNLKVEAVNNYIKINNLNKFLFITPKNWDIMIKLIK